MQKNSVVAKYIYGTDMMVKNTEYDIDDMCSSTVDGETTVCNNDCMNCILECPYKEF